MTFQRVSSYRWPRKAKLTFLEHGSGTVTPLESSTAPPPTPPRLRATLLPLVPRPLPVAPTSFPASQQVPRAHEGQLPSSLPASRSLAGFRVPPPGLWVLAGDSFLTCQDGFNPVSGHSKDLFPRISSQCLCIGHLLYRLFHCSQMSPC